MISTSVGSAGTCLTPLMCPPDLSSLKWGDDGELSPNDTLNLVERLANAEEMSRGTDQSSLNSSSIYQEEPSQEP